MSSSFGSLFANVWFYFITFGLSIIHSYDKEKRNKTRYIVYDVERNKKVVSDLFSERSQFMTASSRFGGTQVCKVVIALTYSREL